jgi:Ca-activated chloride channel family protein
MQFSQPSALWLLILLPVGLFWLAANERFARRAQQAFSLPPSTGRQWRSTARITTAGLALVALIMALSGPQFWAMLKDNPRHHLKLAVGIDVSKSMLAEDVLVDETSTANPSKVINRLNSASLLALRLFEELDGEQAGLFFFARNGIEVVAPTRDQGFLRYMVQHTRLGELTESGSDLKMAITTGVGLLGDQISKTAGAIILISDGEDTENSLDELIAQAEQMNRDQVPVYTVGVGQAEEVYIPIRRPGSTAIDGFYTDAADAPLRTRMQAENLRMIANTSGGRYFAFSDTEAKQLAGNLLTLIPRTAELTIGSSRSRGLKDWTPLLVTLGLVLHISNRLL